MADSKKYNGSTWEHSLRKLTTSTDTITTLPADLYADGTNATVGLVGNMSQSGTPTPQNPIQPSECSERTGNLFDEVYQAHTGATVIYKPVYVGNGDFTLSSNIPKVTSPNVGQLFLLSGDVSSGATTGTNDVYSGLSRTVTSSNGYVTIGYRQYESTTPDVVNYTVMLNTGSTALPYEPYGIKIPISSANTTTPVYLGEVETTRKIKKLVLDGTEAWTKSGNVYYITSIQPDYLRSATITTICTHYQAVTNVEAASAVNVGEIALFSKVGANQRLYIGDDRYANATEFTAYLAQQYAAGTPVTVWYVLATETTGIVNEPLRKIGTYADSITGVTVPTTTGKDTFDVLTSLKPSEVSLTYTGWHDASAKEWGGSEWQ